jgi:MFS family permease
MFSSYPPGFRMAMAPIEVIRQATPEQRRTLFAAAMGWALDAFDAMLYSLVLAMLMRDLGMGKTAAGLLGTLTLLGSGIGGLLFGFLADRLGRKQALMTSILTYSVCSFASGLAGSVVTLGAARFVLGLGMGGEWNTGATIVAESWPTELRAKALSIVQSSWAPGFAAAALVAGPVSRYFGWRAVFFVGYPARTRHVVDSAKNAGVRTVARASVPGQSPSPESPWECSRRAFLAKSPERQFHSHFSASLPAIHVGIVAL